MEKVLIATYQDAAKPLSESLGGYKHSVVVRLGGNKGYDNYEIQINKQTAINNSINKERQKELLINGGCKTLPVLKHPEYPCVIKGVVRSCGTRVFVVNNKSELDVAASKLENCNGYIIEPLFTATSEYRLHCTRNEVFFAVKKIRREGHENDVIINHKNHTNVREFLKPRLWREIQEECLKAMKVLDLDIACFDIMYSSINPVRHEFNIAEANTNPELLRNTFNAYVSALDKIIREKIGAIPDVFEELKALNPDLSTILSIMKKMPNDIIKKFLNELR